MRTEQTMRPFVAVIALVLSFFWTSPMGWSREDSQIATQVKLLTIGNSFANDSTAYLPKFAEAGGKKLVIFRANLPGHSMKQHVSYLEAYEANPSDPAGSPYKDKVDPKTGKENKISLREALESAPWDYVTIQQVSNLSFKPETFEPYAGTLVSYIHKYAPTAKVLVLQTWAYRQDHELLAKEQLTQEQMYEGLRAAYSQLSARYKLQILPVGDAFQAARALPRWHFQYPDPNFDYTSPKEGTLPNETGSLNQGWVWDKDAKTGTMRFRLDGKHCNAEGKYLAASVLYDVLFSKVEENSFCPPEVKADDVSQLRRIAHEAVVKNAAAAKVPVAAP